MILSDISYLSHICNNHLISSSEYITLSRQVLGFFDAVFPQVRLRQLTSRIKVLHIAGSVARPADLAPKAAMICFELIQIYANQ